MLSKAALVFCLVLVLFSCKGGEKEAPPEPVPAEEAAGDAAGGVDGAGDEEDGGEALIAGAGHGEIRMQTMASGLVAVNGFDAAPGVLAFGETMTRKLPAGSYTVTMTYRNGRTETKPVEVMNGSSRWVIFSYVPELLEGDFSKLPEFGVSVSEINPGNYQKYDPKTLSALEVPQWQQSLLAADDFYKKGSFDKAIAEYTRALSLKNDNADAYAGRGNAYRRKGSYGEAAADYTRAIKLKPGYAELYNYRGYVYSRQGNHAKAIEDYTQAIRLKSGYADAWFNRGYAYMEIEDWNRAIADYTQVIGLEPSNAAAYQERAYAWNRAGDTEKARADYAAAENLEAFPKLQFLGKQP
jgi:Flp pilus assembly protein TadD